MENKRKKKKGLKVLIVIFSVIFSLISISHTAITIRAVSNYKYNVKIWEEYNHSGIIDNQWDFEKLKYGFGNIGANGCGAVSIYNILTMENKNPDFPYLIRQFDFCGENVFGIAGSKPSKVIRILKQYGFDVKFTFNEDKFEELAKNSKYAIYLYFGVQGAMPFGHYQLLYNFDGEKFNTINITGKYTFEEISDISHLWLTMMIGVNPK